MIPVPTKMSLVSGKGDASTKLNAFDKALLSAGIANVNLVRLSSIAPPNIELIKLPFIPPGSLVPTAYGSISSDNVGETISAAVAVGFGNRQEYGVIMEFNGRCSAQEAEESVIKMVQESFAYRNRQLEDVQSIAIEHKVEKAGSVIAAAVMSY